MFNLVNLVALFVLTAFHVLSSCVRVFAQRSEDAREPGSNQILSAAAIGKLNLIQSLKKTNKQAKKKKKGNRLFGCRSVRDGLFFHPNDGRKMKTSGKTDKSDNPV